LKKNKQMNHLARYIFSILVVFIIFTSCKKKEKIGFSEDEKILYDSLKNLAFHDIRNRTDSICNVTKDSLYNHYVDSLLALRKEEIDALFNEN
jgi:hypothetical protein